MLLGNRHQRVIYFCLAGMEMAWFTPLFLLIYKQARQWSPFVVFVGLLGAALGLMLVLDLLGRFEVESPYYEAGVLGLVLLSSLLVVRVGLFGNAPLGDFRWLRGILDAVSNFPRELRPEVLLILTNLFLWQRTASATSRDLSFFGVGVSFRLGVLLLIVSAGLYSYFFDQRVTSFLWLYFGLGLTAVSLARTREKAAGAKSAGIPLPWPRLVQLLLAVGLTVGGAVWLSVFYTPGRVKTALGWLRPLWVLLGPPLRLLLQVLFWLLEPVLLWLERQLRRLLAGLGATEGLLEPVRQFLPLGQMAEQSDGAVVRVPPWVWTSLRYAVILLGIILLLGLILLFLDRIRTGSGRDEAEEEIGEDVTLGGGTLSRGLRWLRDMAGLVRRFGLSRQLLAAVSVQNIYANLCRIARRRGYPRRPAQPPDDYLPVLAQAFVGQEEALARITAAYMRVHYGDQPVSIAELARLQQAYRQVRKAEDHANHPPTSQPLNR